MVTTTNEDNVVQKSVMTAFGQVAYTSTFPKGIEAKTQFTYGPFDQVETVTYATGHPITQKYDTLVRRIELDDGDLGYDPTVANPLKSSYNAFDELETQLDGSFLLTGWHRDALGRVTQQCRMDGGQCVTAETDAFDYDHTGGIGRLGRKTRGSIYTDYTYANGQLTGESWMVNGVPYNYAYSYNPLGQVQSVAYPQSPGEPHRFSTTFHYDANQILDNIKDTSTGFAIWTRNAQTADGNDSQETFRNGVIETHAFEAETGRLKSVASGAIPYNPQGTTYGYSAGGNVLTRTEQVQGAPGAIINKQEAFSYDSTDRLTSSQIAGETKYSFDYDSLGNATSANDNLPNCARTFGYSDGSAPHRLTMLTCGTAQNLVLYDGRGNTLSYWDGNAYTVVSYTAFNKPATIDNEYGGMKYTYDADHVRVIKQRYNAYSLPLPAASHGGVWATVVKAGPFEARSGQDQPTSDFISKVSVGGRVVAERIWRYNGASGVEDWHYFHADALGSPGRVSDSTGELYDAESYDAWGNLRDASLSGGQRPFAPNETTVGYTGHTGDYEFNLIDMGGREYLPALHRFLQADPHVSKPILGLSWNRYAYGNNNPTAFTDPSGYDPKNNGPDYATLSSLFAFFSGTSILNVEYYRITGVLTKDGTIVVTTWTVETHNSSGLQHDIYRHKDYTYSLDQALRSDLNDWSNEYRGVRAASRQAIDHLNFITLNHIQDNLSRKFPAYFSALALAGAFDYASASLIDGLQDGGFWGACLAFSGCAQAIGVTTAAKGLTTGDPVKIISGLAAALTGNVGDAPGGGGSEPTMYGPYVHHLTKGGLAEIEASGVLLPGEQDAAGFGGTAVRAYVQDPELLDPSTMSRPAIVFTTSVPPSQINVPQSAVAWKVDELPIKIEKIVYPSSP